MLTFIAPFKPLLTTLVMPPASPLLLMSLGWLLWRRSKRIAWLLVATGFVSLWVFSSSAAVFWMSQQLLPTYAPATPPQMQQAQAIVILGGGIELQSPQYSTPELAEAASARLRYGAYLSKQTQLPMAYSGGIGWAGDSGQISEAEVAQAALKRDWGMSLKWIEKNSRDPQENEQMTHALLAPDGIQTILLITNDWHMQRSIKNFERTGFKVIPAPMGYLQAPSSGVYEYLPSAQGLKNCALVFKEWLGNKVL